MPEMFSKTIIVTSLADGSIQYEVYSGASGQAGVINNASLITSFNMPAADVTNVNANVNGTTNGATRTFYYAQRFGTGAAGDPGMTDI
jgi:hypothetical protein